MGGVLAAPARLPPSCSATQLTLTPVGRRAPRLAGQGPGPPPNGTRFVPPVGPSSERSRERRGSAGAPGGGKASAGARLFLDNPPGLKNACAGITWAGAAAARDSPGGGGQAPRRQRGGKAPCACGS